MVDDVDTLVEGVDTREIDELEEELLDKIELDEL